MSLNEKQEILNKIFYLKKMLEVHSEHKNVIWKDNESGYQEHLNAILDRIIVLKKDLKKYN